MKQKKQVTCLVLPYSVFGDLHAQKAVNVTVSETTSMDGRAFHSVTILSATDTGTNGMVPCRVQQPYEISTTLSISKTTIDIDFRFNPYTTANALTLKREFPGKVMYWLQDLRGKMIFVQQIFSNSTNID